MFTHSEDTDRLIVQLLSYLDFHYLSLTCKYLHSLCDWKILVDRDFGVADLKPENESHKEQYITLRNCSDFGHDAIKKGRVDALQYFYNKGIKWSCIEDALYYGQLEVVEWGVNKYPLAQGYIIDTYPLKSVIWLEEREIYTELHLVMISNDTNIETAEYFYENGQIEFEVFAAVLITTNSVEMLRKHEEQLLNDYEMIKSNDPLPYEAFHKEMFDYLTELELPVTLDVSSSPLVRVAEKFTDSRHMFTKGKLVKLDIHLRKHNLEMIDFIDQYCIDEACNRLSLNSMLELKRLNLLPSTGEMHLFSH